MYAPSHDAEVANLKARIQAQHRRHLAAMNWRSEREVAVLKMLDEFDALPWWQKVYHIATGARLAWVARKYMARVPGFVTSTDEP